MHKDVDYIKDIVFYIYRIFLPRVLSDILSFSSYSTPTSDSHIAWTDSTFSTHPCTQMQNLYSDALNDTEALTITPTSSLAQVSY